MHALIYGEWTPASADRIALEEGIGPLTADQWTAVVACREAGTSDPETISRRTGIEHRELDRLFANSFEQVAARVAGLAERKRKAR